ncbi:T9SS type A sorting domain-containing protein [bacterium]|nr:T9SS type A sorting domain-containing protein [bacterium]
MLNLTNNKQRVFSVLKNSLTVAGTFVLVSTVHAQSISFDVDNLYGNPSCGPFMLNYFGENVFAFEEFNWNSGLGPLGEAATSAVCTGENLAVIAGTGGITLSIGEFDLIQFLHFNPNNFGSMGDNRIYSNGIGEIRLNGDLVLRTTNTTFELEVNYPAPYGTGNFSIGFGQGTIDVGASNAAWVSELDPTSSGLVNFNFTSISQVVNIFPDPFCSNWYGYYDVSLTVGQIGTVTRSISNHTMVGAGMGELVGFSGVGAEFWTNSADYGANDNREFMGMRINGNPGGNLPGGINNIITNHFWRFGTTIPTFNLDITFDLADAGGINNINNLRILRREDGETDWQEYGSISVVDGTHLKANGVTGFSEWTVGSVGDDPLAIKLASFEARQVGNNVELSWQTETEENNAGFVIYRADAQTESFYKIASYETHFELKSKNSNSNFTQNYSFTDKTAELNKTYIYRLADVNFDGVRNIHSDFDRTITLKLEGENLQNKNLSFELEQNFPNPFNPTTEIAFTLKRETVATLKIYNTVGQEIKTLVSEKLVPANYKVSWNGTDENGKSVASGIYFYKLETANGTSDTKKMILLK